MRNQDGGVQTNRDSAVQIEVVGFAGRPKDIPTLRSVAKLCRWIETTHTVLQTWPNGKPRASTNGNDPGGHNRTATTWDQEGGHYGHSQVPENTHWDPGYTDAELAIVTPDAVFDAHDELAARAGVIGAPRSADELVPTETADAIIERLIARLAANESINAARPSRVDVRVAVGGVAVRVILEGGVRGPVKSTRRSKDRGRSSKTKRRRGGRTS